MFINQSLLDVIVFHARDKFNQNTLGGVPGVSWLMCWIATL